MILLEMLLAGGLVAGGVMIVLIVWPAPGAKLPDPAKVAGMPMAGPASQKAAHAAIIRKKV